MIDPYDNTAWIINARGRAQTEDKFRRLSKFEAPVLEYNITVKWNFFRGFDGWTTLARELTRNIRI